MFKSLKLYTKTFVFGFAEGLSVIFNTRTSLREILVSTIIFAILLPISLISLFFRWLFKDIFADVKRGIKWKS